MHLLGTNLSLRGSQVLLVLHRTIHNLLDQHLNRRVIRRRTLQTLNLTNLFRLRTGYNGQTVGSGALDLRGKLLVVGADVDAALLDGEDGGLRRVEARGAGLEL
jgi:hypothetical protein